MISLYTGYGGDWLIIALLTVIVSGLSVASSSTLLILYKFLKLVEVNVTTHAWVTWSYT